MNEIVEELNRKQKGKTGRFFYFYFLFYENFTP